MKSEVAVLMGSDGGGSREIENRQAVITAVRIARHPASFKAA
jgi:hypothetical protein